jgi:phosphatidylglycerol lysyltransferase
MNLQSQIKRQIRVHREFVIEFLGILVAANGVYILASLLLVLISSHRASRLNDTIIDLPLIIGLSLLYLGALLRRRKRTAWLVTVLAYAIYLSLGIAQFIRRQHLETMRWHEIIRAFIVPIIVLFLLLSFRKEYFVKSDIQGFSFATRISIIILLVAFVYGVAGFLLLDDSDFHREIDLTTAAHYTIDQFNITTNKPLRPYTKRAHLFIDSLSVVSAGAVAYAALALFQPLRFKLTDHAQDRERLRSILDKSGAPSEEFFKLWPHDKQYVFDQSASSALAFHVSRGVALCLSGPVGDATHFSLLMRDFSNMCFGNDWLPALIHVEESELPLYEQHGYSLQKLGQEAIVDLTVFNKTTANNKYFRQIRNKFNKHGYSYEVLKPPHNQAIVDRLKVISDEWLSHGGRAERGFVMGYFTPNYIQQCSLMIARDAANTIQAFLNLVPADFDHNEATYDMLRHTNDSLGNINDFLLMGLMDYLGRQNYKQLNLGLCPLVGLDEEPDQERNSLINGFLAFAYANGDRFYSFQGLHRFKAKYEPDWRDRYLAYQGGLRGFTRTISALIRAMRI